MMLVEKSFDTGEVMLNYAEGPDNGPPLLFLHGGVGQWKSYHEMIPAFTDNYHVYALDFRGNGKSDRSPDKYLLRHSLEDTSIFITDCIGQPTNLFGYSYGGWVSIWCTNRIPDRVNSVILFDPPIDIKGIINRFESKEYRLSNLKYQRLCGKPMDDVVKVLREDLPTWRDETLKVVAESYYYCDSRWFDVWLEDEISFFEGFDIEQCLKEISCDALLIQADPERGSEVSDSDVERVKEINPSITHKKIEGIGHNFDRVDPLIKTTLDFLESIR